MTTGIIRHGRGWEARKDGLANCLRGAMGGHSKQFVLVTPKSTNTPSKFIPSTSTTKTMETAPQSLPMNFPTSTSSAEDSLAKVSALLEKEGDLTTQEERFSLTLLESLGLKDPAYYGLRTSKVSSLTMGVAPLIPSSEHLMSWGMTFNGKCLTARTTSLSPPNAFGTKWSTH